MSNNKLLNSSRLSKGLQDALQADAKRQAIDSAKKRAVGQHVDYETFQNMVTVAHLKPLQDASSTVKVTAAPSWQFSAKGSLRKAHHEEDTQLRAESEMPQQATLPSTADAFLRAWRRQCKTQEAKWHLLVTCGLTKLRLWFKSSLPADVISDILVVCGTALQQSCSNVQSGISGHPDMPVPHQIKAGPIEQEQTASVPLVAFGLLDVLAGSERFELMRKLLGKQAKLVASRMFETLQEQLSLEVNDLGFSQEQLAQLRSLYKL